MVGRLFLGDLAGALCKIANVRLSVSSTGVHGIHSLWRLLSTFKVLSMHIICNNRLMHDLRSVVPFVVGVPQKEQLHYGVIGGRYVSLMTKYLIFYIGLICSNVSAQDIEVKVDDCGPLERGELGVVFTLKPHGSGKSYFTKGPVKEVCANLTKAKRVIGYEEGT